MIEDGFKNVINTDISPICISKMRKKHQNYLGLEYREMDAKNLNFDTRYFDIIIDKGLIDSLRCEENFQFSVMQYLKEIHRVLNNDGVFLCVSYSVPFIMLKYIEHDVLQWNVTYQEIPKQTDLNDPIQEGVYFTFYYVEEKLNI